MLKDYLNELTATYAVMYGKLHQYHWYVKGTSFFTLHEKFEELYDQATADMDTVAERILQIGGKPVSSLGEFIDKAWIKESPYKKEISATDMVKNLLADYKTLQKKFLDGIEMSDKEGDDVTNDMLIGLKTELDKTIWMLDSYLA